MATRTVVRFYNGGPAAKTPTEWAKAQTWTGGMFDMIHRAHLTQPLPCHCFCRDGLSDMIVDDDGYLIHMKCSRYIGRAPSGRTA